MRKATQFAAILIIFLGLLSCQSDEVEPAKNPRFSVAFIQDVDDNGVQFAANVYDFGSDEILEYGFAYSSSPNPRKENSEFVSGIGKPEGFFEITAKHAMERGKSYNVVAFMKTTVGLVYSASVNFKSQGSEGFIFERIEVPDPLYFNDTITVYGKNISRLPNNYTVIVENEPAYVVKTSDNFFKFLLPRSIKFESKHLENNIFEYYFKVLEKTFSTTAPFNFRKPEFKTALDQRINYNEDIALEGNYLDAVDLNIKYKYENFEYNLPVKLKGQNRITFAPAALFMTQTPQLEIQIRGEKYIVENVFTLNPSDFVPDQEFEIRLSQNTIITAKTINKNFYIKFNKLTSNVKDSFIHIADNASTIPREIKFILQGNINAVARTNYIYFENFGVSSGNAVKVKLLDPSIPIVIIPEDFRGAHVDDNRAASLGDKGYFFNSNKLFRLDPANPSFEFVAQEGNGFLANIFAMQAPNGKLYSGATQGGDSNSRDFFEYDPLSNKFTKLPNIPTGVMRPRSVYTTTKYLYYEGGFHLTSRDVGLENFESDERWRYSFSEKTWVKLPDKITKDGYIRRHITFRYQNQLYMIGIEGGKNYLYVLDENSEKWSRVSALTNNLGVTSNEIFVIGDNAYVGYSSGFWKLNMKTYEDERMTFINGQDLNFIHAPLMTVQIGDKFYFYNKLRSIIEFDHNYF